MGQGKKVVAGVIVVCLALCTALVLTRRSDPARVVGFTVTSTADGNDARPGDGICRTASGRCTLRSAITEANANASPDRIDFAIAGRGVHTIRPRSPLPAITQPVTIDGYSQLGARANSASSPQPLNGTLTVELDGEDTTDATGLQLRAHANGSLVRGLVINRFGGIGVDVSGVAEVRVQGDYIGTDPTGLVARPNGDPNGPSAAGLSVGAGGAATDHTTSHTLVGGPRPADRNVLSGNNGAGLAIGSEQVTVQGNYDGVGSDGMTKLGNGRSVPDQSGGITIDYADGVTIGGPSRGTTNVFAGNDNSGISLLGAQHLTIQGNYFGLGHDGKTAIPNDTGLQVSRSKHVQVGGTSAATRNVFSGNAQNGLGVDDTSSDVTVQGNYIGTDTSGVLPVGNKYGIGIADSSDLEIGGPGTGEGNLIANNSYANVLLQVNEVQTGGTDTTIQGNLIGTDRTGAINPSFKNGVGVLVYGPSQGNLIGGTGAGDGNVIAGNTGGVLVGDYTLTPVGTTFSAKKIAILGNRIHGNTATPQLPGFTSGLGIDLFGATEDDLPPDGVDSTVGAGPTPNDGLGADTGANDDLNTVILTSARQHGTDLDVVFDLDAAGGPTNQHRVELFANDATDPSGSGEGQTFLGAVTVGDGAGQSRTLTLPANLDLTGKTISATTTAVDGTTRSGFGSTSEFSPSTLVGAPPGPT